MRRQAPNLPISPKLLKHFAIATVVITGLLALFAGGDGGDVGAKIEQRAAQTELARAEPASLGRKTISNTLAVRPGTDLSGDFDSDGRMAGTGDLGGGRIGPPTQAHPDRPALPAYAPPPGLLARPGATVSRTGMIGAKPRKPFHPNAEQQAAILRKSAERSGALGND